MDAATAIFLTAVSVAGCEDAATANFLASAGCKDAATANFGQLLPVAGCMDVATAICLTAVSVAGCKGAATSFPHGQRPWRAVLEMKSCQKVAFWSLLTAFGTLLG